MKKDIIIKLSDYENSQFSKDIEAIFKIMEEEEEKASKTDSTKPNNNIRFKNSSAGTKTEQ
tara:strand:+ start:199 stop:381 length:183 start_codon:yes stop_codon:yes gene_type:complete